MFVKICGLTNFEDASAAVEMGAQALGFIFVRKSPRFVHPAALGQWIGGLPPYVRKVGVFANEPRTGVEAICSELGLDTVQLHGDETPLDHPRGVQVWRAFRVVGNRSLEPHYPADAILLDGPGSGRVFDWSVCAGIKRPLVLAGGLDESNVAQAIRVAQPWAVDVASGIESEPGRKDHGRMRRFIDAALRPVSSLKEAAIR